MIDHGEDDQQTQEWYQRIHPDDLDRAIRAWSIAVETGGYPPTEYRCRVRDGSYRWFLFAATALHDADGRRTGFSGTVIDRHAARVAEQTRAREQEEMARLTSILRSAQQLGRIGGWSYEVDTGRVTWTDELCDLHEVPHGFQPTPEDAIEFYLPEDRPVIRRSFEHCVVHGSPYDISLRIVTASGRVMWCRTTGRAARDETGRIVRVLGAFQDIDAQQHVELALRESEERFRVLSEATSDVVVDWVPERGTTWWSGDIERVLGVDEATLAARGLDAIVERVRPEDQDRARSVVRRARDGQLERWSDVTRIRLDGGRSVDLEVNGRVLLDAGGRGARLVVSFVDVTERRAMERRLAEAHHLESLGQLTGGIAHDINNLLAVVLGNAELLADRVEGDDAEHVDMIRDATLRGGDLVARLLSFARRRTLEPVSVDAVELVRSAGDLARRALGERWDLRLDVANGPLPILVDPTEFESSLLNLCINARDALPDGGIVEIVVRSTGHESIGEPDEHVIIEVRDQGVGMTDDVRHRAFEPFFTTKAAGAGSGLGLSMVYGFARQSGGDAVIESNPGIGTTVRVVLPLERSRPVAGTDGADDGTTPRRSLRVLLVEDDDAVRTVTAAQLRALGHRVRAVASAAEALHSLETDPELDLLLTDVVMPGGMDGHELAAAVTRSRPDLPVVYASGYADETVVQGAMDRRRTTMLLKPYRRSDLVDAIERSMAEG